MSTLKDSFSTFGQYNKARKEIRHIHIGNKSLKPYLFADSRVIYVDNPKKFMHTSAWVHTHTLYTQLLE